MMQYYLIVQWSVDLDDENEVQISVSGVAVAFVDKVSLVLQDIPYFTVAFLLEGKGGGSKEERLTRYEHLYSHIMIIIVFYIRRQRTTVSSR